MQNYDAIIIGGGISGMMAAYRLSDLHPEFKILLVEKGNDLKDRICPIVTKKTEKCVKCKTCAIMEGLSGAGAFSDGKYIISTEYGGWLTDYLNPKTVINYIEQADEILVKFGATQQRYMPDNSLKLLCLKNGLHMQQAQVKHLGTDSNFETMQKIAAELKNRVEILTQTKATDVNIHTHEVILETSTGNIECAVGRHIIFSVGRAGSHLFTAWCRKNNIPLSNNQVDVGVRVELPAIIWDHFSRKIYEPKIWCRTKQYGDITRMFCFNERGNVVIENTSGVLTVNGHSYREAERKTENSNFALLSTTRFTAPFNEPIEYARFVASLSNKVSGGSVLIQRLGDLENGRRTNEHRLSASTTRPTLNAVPGDLSLCMPKRQLDNIIETIHALDVIAPGTANYDTLLYGVECKFYSARPKNNDFELFGCEHIYAVGDGAGITRSLSQAAANGLYIADKIGK